MNPRRKLLFALGVIALLVLLWLLRPRPSATPPPAAHQPEPSSNEPAELPRRSPPPPSTLKSEAFSPSQEYREIVAQNEAKRRAITNEALLWRTPLVYFGKVVDESNKPIAGVKVSFNTSSINESLTGEKYDNGTVTTDARGIFKIDGVRGIGMVFQLYHPNYYSYNDNATDYDVRDYPKKGIPPTSEETAILFRMHSKGNPVALIDRRGGLHKPADGTTMDFPLRGKTRGEIIGQLQAQAWKGEPDPQNNNRYDWKVKITVPSGGVLATTNEFDFVAPESGYQQTLEIGMSKDDPNWKPGVNEKLFFKLPNYFVRGQANVDLYHDFYFSMQYFVNPDGSGNLENDPSQPFQEP